MCFYMLFFIISDLFNQFPSDMKHFTFSFGEILQKNYYFLYLSSKELLFSVLKPHRKHCIWEEAWPGYSGDPCCCFPVSAANCRSSTWWHSVHNDLVHCLDQTSDPGLNKEHGQDIFLFLILNRFKIKFKDFIKCRNVGVSCSWTKKLILKARSYDCSTAY